MPEHDYLPRADVDFLLWHDGLLDNVRKHAATYGVTAAELGQLAAANQALHAHVAGVAETAAMAAAAVSAKDVDLFVREAALAGTEREVASAVSEIWRLFSQADPGIDFTHIFNYIQSTRTA